ncbi:MAG: LPS export ABC transporter periplasmic protein LptC [Proteobacteria bacterium]|nr:LPS export ABC transporter periplasmic protein LptC [Pseudomonadota bacterium]
MKWLRITFVVLILAVLTVMSLIFYKNINLITPKETVKELLDPLAEFSLQNPHFVETSGDRVVMEVDADKAFYYQGEEKVKLENPKAVLFGSMGEKTEINARHGVIDSETNDIQVEGDVRLVSPDGYLLKTDSLKYRKEKQIINSKSPVELTGDGFKVKGVGLKVNMDTGKITIYKDVVAVFEYGFKGGPFGKKQK